VFAADLDGDGDQDLLSALWLSELAWYENNGEGSFEAQHVATTDNSGYYSALATDLDEDGDLDVLSMSWRGKISWHENVGDDLGDAPVPYATLQSEDGARHADRGPTLGALRDAESDGQSGVRADGDDLHGINDEDGVTFGSQIRVGQAHTVVTVNVQNAPDRARLSAWIDFDGDGSWGGPGEKIADDLVVKEGVNAFDFDVPIEAATGDTYARFRLSTAGGLTPSGPAADGEVEDYRVSILEPAGPSAFFGAEQIITTDADRISTVIAADLDGDGDQDVLSESYWYENVGGGKLRPAADRRDGCASRPRSVFAADSGQGRRPGRALGVGIRTTRSPGTRTPEGEVFGAHRQIASRRRLTVPATVLASRPGRRRRPGRALGLLSTMTDVAWYENDGGGRSP
jgi:hypothetical protein